jgi:alpha-beta hydrolase superfamily lysophospholipase
MINSKENTAVEEIAFASNGYLLKGCLHLPPVDHPPVVLGSHGLFSDKNSVKQIELAYQCIKNNIAYFRFDHRGCGESRASFETLTSMEVRCTDLKAAATMLNARDDIGSQMALFGSSMGGAVCLSVAGLIQAAAVITWAAPVRSAGLVQEPTGSPHGSDTPFKNNPFDISHQLDGLRNILIFHSDADETVPLPHAEEIYRRVQNPKKLVVFQQSDHRMNNPEDQKKFIRESIIWLKNFLKPVPY